MRPPIFVRSLTSAERSALEAGLRSGDAFILRRCQIVLASARGHAPPHIAQHLGCNDQTVRNAIRAFNTAGLACADGPRDPIRFKRRSIPPEPSDLPHRQAWFLGQWEPDWKAWEAQSD